MAKLKWKHGESDGRECYRLRRGDLTLAVVVKSSDGLWSVRGYVPGQREGFPADRTWLYVEAARRAAVEWVRGEEAQVRAREEARS